MCFSLAEGPEETNEKKHQSATSTERKYNGYNRGGRTAIDDQRDSTPNSGLLSELITQYIFHLIV